MTPPPQSTTTARPIAPEPTTPPEPVAVVDMGTASIRMAIAEVLPNGELKQHEKLAVPVTLGKDTFTRNFIRKQTIEDCVKALRRFQRLLGEYRITDDDQVRVVATSAVREASNRLAFVDRIFSATGFDVEILDEAEVTRTTFLGVLPYLQGRPELKQTPTVVAEVGGGSTEVLIVDDCDVVFSHGYRLGSLRLTQTLDSYQTPQSQTRNLIESQIALTLKGLSEPIQTTQAKQLLALGGDIRWAADRLHPGREPGELVTVRVERLKALADEVLSQSVDRVVSKYGLSYPEAETLAAALLSYLHLAKMLGLDSFLVCDVNLRNGLLRDMGHKGPWSDVLRRQIEGSALDLARRYDVDEAHARHVAKLSAQLFREFGADHQLDPRYELILQLAALLHEVGLYISQNGFHKHTLYVIRNSELFGLGQSDLLLTALVARYHRRASPKPTHDAYGNLGRDRRVAVSKMAALLRVADALDKSRSQHIDELHCQRTEKEWIVSVPGVDDLSLEKLALEQKGGLFEEIFGVDLVLRRWKRG